MKWYSIHTAPKDGTPVLLWCGAETLGEPFQVVGVYKTQDEPKWEGWVDVYEGVDLAPCTFWMPLPEPPPRF